MNAYIRGATDKCLALGNQCNSTYMSNDDDLKRNQTTRQIRTHTTGSFWQVSHTYATSHGKKIHHAHIFDLISPKRRTNTQTETKREEKVYSHCNQRKIVSNSTILYDCALVLRERSFQQTNIEEIVPFIFLLIWFRFLEEIHLIKLLYVWLSK